MDPYDALGLKKTASDDEIKKAYRKIARTSHPDLNPDDAGAETKFKAASAAYDLLKDPETRAKFDRGEIDATGAERHQQRQYYRDYAGAADNPYRGRQSHEDFTDASSFFADFLRQRGQGRRASSQGFDVKGQDVNYTLEVAFMDAVNGGTTRITLPEGGTLDVKIPKGTADGQTIRLRGKGMAGFGGGAAGDALVTLTVQSHPTFRRDGDDIHVILPISLDEAVLGGKVEAPTIDGPVNLTVPKGASSGQTLRLRERGVQSAKGTKRGDQRVELRIVSPREIDPELSEFMENSREDSRIRSTQRIEDMRDVYTEDEAVAAVATLTHRRITSFVRARIVTPVQTESGPKFRKLDLVRMELLCDLSEEFALDEDALAVVISLIDQLHDARADLRELAEAIASQPNDVRARIGETFVQVRRTPRSA